ncbi:hypothetical protein D3C71_973960 [compost metagenome]
MAQQRLGAEPVELAGRTGTHERFDQAQAVALASADVGDDCEFALDAAQLEPGGGHRRSDARLHTAKQRLA